MVGLKPDLVTELMTRKTRVRRSPLPATPPPPQLALSAAAVPEGDGWGHEIKLDGYRMLCRRSGNDVRFISRNGKDWTRKVQPLVAAVQQLAADEFIIDGEVAVLGAAGVTDFQALQSTISKPRPVGLIYFVFDAIHVADLDLRPAPLPDRKNAIKEILDGSAVPSLQVSDHIVGNGRAVFENAKALNVEGIVSKRLAAPYKSGRSDAWRKVKFNKRSEFVVVGYTDSESVDHALGAMMLAERTSGGDWEYVGRVGTGFTQETLALLRSRLESVRTDECPLPKHPPDIPIRAAHWVEPTLVVEIEYLKRSTEGILRFPSFKGIRDDVAIEDCCSEDN